MTTEAGNVEAVFSILAFASDGKTMLKHAVEGIKSVAHIRALSSIYSVRSHPGQIETAHNILEADRFMGLVVAVRVVTNLQPPELLRRIQRKVTERDSRFVRQHLEMELLLYGDLHLMSPTLTVPHPELHLLPELVIPASEVWGDYQHMVLGENLYQLAKHFTGKDWGEFHSQGRSLLDLD